MTSPSSIRSPRSSETTQWRVPPENVEDTKAPRKLRKSQNMGYKAVDEAYSTVPVSERSPKAKPSFASLDDEEGPWSRKTLLSLDGGGVRGLSSLFILQRIMENVRDCELQRDELASNSAHSPLFEASASNASSLLKKESRYSNVYLPCHYFDYIAGTSTGGLIAIMLGRLKMNVDDAIQEYQDLSKNVFEKPTTRFRRLIHNYDRGRRRRTLEHRFGDLASRFDESGSRQAPTPFKSDPERCRTVVCSVKSVENNALQLPYLFRSYDNPRKASYPVTKQERSFPATSGPTIWQVARATSAAPSFFKPIELELGKFHDGVVNLNNPSWQLFNEIKDNRNDSSIDVLLSIGGGNAEDNTLKAGSPKTRLLDPFSTHSYSEFVDEEVRSESEENAFSYYRLDADGIAPRVRLDEWKPIGTGELTIQKIKDATRRYLDTGSVRSEVRKIAEKLVEKRILRSQTMKWECFATGTRYRCPLPECEKRKDTVFLHQNALTDHLRIAHDRAPPDSNHYDEIQFLIEQGRTNSGASSTLT